MSNVCLVATEERRSWPESARSVYTTWQTRSPTCDRSATIRCPSGRIKGASRAAKKVAQRKARKFKAKSVQVEQQLVARVGVLCDLVLLGSESWNAYHAQLQLGGQREAIIESTGGDVSKSVAAKAWKEAEKRAFKQAMPKPIPPFSAGKRADRTGTGGKGLGTLGATKPCYWCNKMGHLGRECADKKARKPPHPKARANKWLSSWCSLL